METLRKNARAGGGIFCLTLTAFLFLTIIGQTILNGSGVSGDIYTAVTLLFSPAVLTGAFFFGKKWGIPVFRFRPTFKGVSSAILLAAGVFLGFGFINGLIGEIIVLLGGKAQAVSISVNDGVEYVLFSVVACLIPAVCEEMFFRGILLGSVRDINTLPAVLTCGLFFALYHCNAVQFAYQFIYGCALAFLALKTQDVFCCILAHFINNFAIVTFLHFGVEINFYHPLAIGLGLLLFSAFILFTAFGFGGGSISGGKTVTDNTTFSNAEHTLEKTDKSGGVADGEINKDIGSRKTATGVALAGFYKPFGIAGMVTALAIIVLTAI